jgi:hypothetical protein
MAKRGRNFKWRWVEWELVRCCGGFQNFREFRQDDRIFRMDRMGKDCVRAAAFLDFKPVFLLCALCVLRG